MNTEDYWRKFWNNYRVRQATTTEDLFFQVGKTINKVPIEQKVFDHMIGTIRQQLKLSKQDALIDLCCGNGLVTYELSDSVEKILAVDFAEHLIHTAVEFRSKENIVYMMGDAIEALENCLKSLTGPTVKILMHDALAYFQPEDVERMLAKIKGGKAGRPMLFLLTGIPDFDRRWNFYNTPERKKHFLENEDKIANDGMGRWWKRSELADICQRYGFAFTVAEQPALSNYRMDLLIEI